MVFLCYPSLLSFHIINQAKFITSQYYGIQKIRWYQKTILWNNYTTGLLLNTNFRVLKCSQYIKLATIPVLS